MALIFGKIDITSLLKCVTQLERALAYAETETINYPKKFKQYAAIQYFTCAYELAWKTMKRLLAIKGIAVHSPTATFREAVKESYISDPEIWFKFQGCRSLTDHAYDQEVTHNIYVQLRDFEKELKQFIDTIQKLI